MTNNYRRVLRQVASLGIAFGVMDIAYFAYCMTHAMSYSPVWGIGAIAIAILLFRENLQAVSWMGDAAIPLLVGMGMFFLHTLFTRPLDLWMVHLRLYPIHAAYFIGFHICLFAALSWAYQQLRSQVVLEQRAAAGINTKFPRIIFGLVVGLTASFVLLMHSTLNGDDAAEAIRRARGQLGEQYRYYVSGMKWSGDRVTAKVTAYSENEIRHTEVNWSQDNAE